MDEHVNDGHIMDEDAMDEHVMDEHVMDGHVYVSSLVYIQWFQSVLLRNRPTDHQGEEC